MRFCNSCLAHFWAAKIIFFIGPDARMPTVQRFCTVPAPKTPTVQRFCINQMQKCRQYNVFARTWRKNTDSTTFLHSPGAKMPTVQHFSKSLMQKWRQYIVSARFISFCSLSNAFCNDFQSVFIDFLWFLMRHMMSSEKRLQKKLKTLTVFNFSFCWKTY